LPDYKEQASVIEASLDELCYITEFMGSRENEGGAPFLVLIGGWAVHSFNPWYGSIDIDLIVTARARRSLTQELVDRRGFERVRRDDDTKTIKKFTPDRKEIIIDFAVRDKIDPFEGIDKGLFYSMVDGHTSKAEFRKGHTIQVPNRTLLTFFKMKAAWDRRYRLDHGSSHDPEWEKGKVMKDHSDILALLDPKSGGREIEINELGRLIDSHAFLGCIFDQIADDAEAIDWYERLSPQDARTLIGELKAALGI
jgi:hypothetical protein